MIEGIRYDDVSQQLWINDGQYFTGVLNEIWNFSIGGHRVIEKWLKARRGRTLTFGEIRHIQSVVAAISKTLELVTEIDAALEDWPFV